jgi:hypothetical protein
MREWKGESEKDRSQYAVGMERLTIFACLGATFVENVAVAGLLGMLSYVAQYSYARSGPGIEYCISPQSTQRTQRGKRRQ